VERAGQAGGGGWEREGGREGGRGRKGEEGGGGEGMPADVPLANRRPTRSSTCAPA
jgi:hypothetical protein